MKTEIYNYKKVNDLYLPMEVHFPKQPITDETITVVWLHGGGWHSTVGKKKEWKGSVGKKNAAALADLGFIAIDADYRSWDTTEQTSIASLMEDCEDMMRYVRKLPFVNPDKIAVGGDSAGGHLAVMLGLSQNDDVRPNCVAACNPVLNLKGSRWVSLVCNDVVEEISPFEQKPVKCADFLIMHGTEDVVVSVDESREFAKKLVQMNHNCQFMELPGKKHAFILFDYREEEEVVNGLMQMIADYIRQTIN